MKKCNKIYPYRSSLWKHVRKCEGIKITKTDRTRHNKINDRTLHNQMNDILSRLVKIEAQTCQPTTIINNNTTNNNVTNNNSNTFNMQIQQFLNIPCKTAKNINDLYDNNLNPHMSDILKLKNNDVITVLSNISVKSLTNYPTLERPMHCFASKEDPPTMQLRIKGENNEWSDDQESKDILLVMSNSLGLRMQTEYNKLTKTCDNSEIMDVKTFNKKMNTLNHNELSPEFLNNIARVITIKESDMNQYMN